MKKVKLLCSILALSGLLLFSENVYASEIDTESQTEDNIEDNIENNVEDSVENEDMEIPTEIDEEFSQEDTTEQNDENLLENEPVTTNIEQEDEIKDIQSTTSYGWLNVIGEMENCNFADEFILTFKFTNIDTKEELEKAFSSSNNFSNTIKLNYGTYDIELLNTEYNDNVLYDTQVIISDKENKYNISVKNIDTTQVPEDDIAEQNKTNTALELLKNNIIFLVLLLGCGGYLLYKEIQRRR